MKKLIIFLMSFVVIFSTMFITVNAADYDSGSSSVSDGFTFESAWKHHYYLDLTDKSSGAILRHIFYTDSDSSPQLFEYSYTQDITMYNNLGNGVLYVWYYGPGLVGPGTWEEISSVVGSTPLHNPIPKPIENYSLSGNIGLVSSDGLTFYIPPTEQTLEEVTKGAVQTEMKNLTKTTLTIVLCGVGCLVLLIGLLILPKVLRKFLH